MTKNKLTFWACDYSEKSGEGNLARKFVNEVYNKRKLSVKTLKQKKKISHKYIIPFVGVINCWKYYFKGHDVGYINYLPLWNFFIFLFLPPKTKIGPITGGALYLKTNTINFLIRKIIFPICYKISEFILNLRYKKNIYFSTELLKKYLSKKTINKSKFNFVLDNLKFNKKKKIKDIDFLIYHRLHMNKSTFFDYNFIKKLAKLNYKIYIIGDKLNIKGVNNLGYLLKNKLSLLQSRSKYSLCSQENIYSFFTIECITNHVKILVNSKYMQQIKFLRKDFININKFRLIKKLK